MPKLMYKPINGWTKAVIIKKIKTDFTQWSGSETNYACYYRSSNNAKSQIRCAVGVFIPDEMYTPAMDGGTKGGSIVNLLRSFPALEEVMPLPTKALSWLQAVHDGTSDRASVKEELLDWIEENVA